MVKDSEREPGLCNCQAEIVKRRDSPMRKENVGFLIRSSLLHIKNCLGNMIRLVCPDVIWKWAVEHFFIRKVLWGYRNLDSICLPSGPSLPGMYSYLPVLMPSFLKCTTYTKHQIPLHLLCLGLCLYSLFEPWNSWRLGTSKHFQ